MTNSTYATTFTKQRLREVYWKSCSHEGYVNILIYRPLALICAVGFAKLRRTPNQVSMISFLIGIVGIILFAFGDYRLALLGLIPFHLGKMLDCADGQLAKLTGQTSALGAFLDPFLDRVTDAATMCALAVGYRLATGSDLALYLVLGLLSVWFIGTYLDKFADTGASNLDNLRQTTSGLPPSVRRLLKWDGGFTGLVTTLAIVFGQIPALIILTLAVATLPVPLSLLGLVRRLRKQ